MFFRATVKNEKQKFTCKHAPFPLINRIWAVLANFYDLVVISTRS